MRRSRSRALVTAAVAAACTPFLLTGCIFPSPSPGSSSSLNAVAAVTASNAWAVGSFVDGTGSHELMERWNGKSWQEVFLPPPIGSRLEGITAVSASNVWAVGPQRTLHYGGLGWRSVPNPAGVTMAHVASTPDGSVYGIGDAASHDTLFVMTAGGWRAVSIIPKPTSHRPCDGGSAGTTDLSALGGSDIWVVGNTFGTGANNARSCTFATRWNGTTWQSFATPSVAGEPELLAVSARAANDVWAVGESITVFTDTGFETDRSIVLHWNGTKWGAVPTVDSLGGGQLFDIDATAAGVWAVGSAPQLSGETTDLLIKKFTGRAMVDQPIQRLHIAGTPFDDSGTLEGVSVRDGVVTSVGSYLPTIKGIATLTDRRNAN
jgi:hypothetical protein